MEINGCEESKEISEDQEVIIPLLRTHKLNNSEKLKDNSTTSPAGAIFVLINAALGAGMLAFPYAFWSSGGVAIGFLLQTVRICDLLDIKM